MSKEIILFKEYNEHLFLENILFAKVHAKKIYSVFKEKNIREIILVLVLGKIEN